MSKHKDKPPLHGNPDRSIEFSRPRTNRVLLVGSCEENFAAISSLLDQFNYEHERAASGAEAIRCVFNRDYAAVLMDIQMTGMNGLEATEAIRSQENEKGIRHVPIIGVAAHSGSGDRHGA